MTPDRDDLRDRLAALDGDPDDAREWALQQLGHGETSDTPEDIAAEYRVYDADGELVAETSDDLVIIATPTAEFVAGYGLPAEQIPDRIDHDDLPIQV